MLHLATRLICLNTCHQLAGRGCEVCMPRRAFIVGAGVVLISLAIAIVGFGMTASSALAGDRSPLSVRIAKLASSNGLDANQKGPFSSAKNEQIAQGWTYKCNCPPNYPQCVPNPLRREVICCETDAVRCVGEKSTYCCPSGSVCGGALPSCRALPRR